jgi:hypothetical protein
MLRLDFAEGEPAKAMMVARCSGCAMPPGAPDRLHLGLVELILERWRR